jgi:hypothetical protein
MFRLLQQQRYPWAPGSFVLTVALLAVLGRLLPAPDNSGHFSGGILTIEIGALALAAGVVVAALSLLRAPQASPFARTPSTRLTRARLFRALARAAVPLGVGVALLCQGIGRPLVQNDSTPTTPNAAGVLLLVLAQLCFFGGFALGIFLRPFSLARVTRPALRTLLWMIVVLEWVLLFAAAYLANGLGQQGPATFMQALPTLLFVDVTSVTLIAGGALLFRRALAQAEEDAGGPIIRRDWPHILWDCGGMKICLYGIALAIIGFGALLPFDAPAPAWLSAGGVYLLVMLAAAFAPAPAPATLPASTAGATNGSAGIAGHAGG